MTRFLPIGALLFLTSVILSGCTERAPVPAPSTEIAAPVRARAVLPARAPATATPTAGSALEQAHQAYQAAYENYVRMLRESGPQTMETLNALADYQKKYQIYQMLMSAEKDIPGLASPSP